MTFENLLLERDGAVVVITINRPRVLNALNNQTLDDLRRALLTCQSDRAVRAVVITGAGDRAFVAGADIRELATESQAHGKMYAQRGQQVLDLIEHLGKPVVAAINGFALGGGCELAMACTLRLASDTAHFGQPEINLGLIPGYAGTQRLPRLVGRGIALDLLLTGRQIAADEALRIGLVNRVVAAGALKTAARMLAAELAQKAPIATACMLEAVHRGLETSLDAAQDLEATLFGRVAATVDSREGMAAFLEKRAPVFIGE